VPVALLFVKVGQEDTCGALTRHFAEVNIERERATNVRVVDERPFGRVVPLDIMNEGSVVLTNFEAFILGLEELAVEALHIEFGINAIIFLVRLFNVADECLPFGRLRTIVTITVAITIISLFVLTVGPNVEAVN
jgi:hypothetical protein